MRITIALLLCALASHAQAEFALTPFPYATIVSQGEEGSRPREFVLGSVEKNRRETSIERFVSVTATRRWTTFEVPQDTDPEKLKVHYADQLAGQLLFQCDGRDCGRSNTWANQIFGQALLYGRDQEQVYLAAQVDDQLLAVYLIKRGNGRQYAHIEVWQPELMPPLVRAATTASQWSAWLAEFTRTGFAVIPRVQPQANGELSTAALAVLGSLAATIPATLGANLQLVCHLYSTSAVGSKDAAANLTETIAAATRCAEDASAVFAEAGTAVTPRGVGPLAPNQARARSRLVLVAPERLTR